MVENSHDSLMYQVISSIQNINKVSGALEELKVEVFTNISLDLPKFQSAELDFIRLVSWLYVAYFEAGNVGVKFLLEKSRAFEINKIDEIEKHLNTIKKLRTYLQHNLETHKKHDIAIKEACEYWLEEACGSPVPNGEESWGNCLIVILKETILFLETLLKSIRCIESDTDSERMLKEWKFRIDRFHPPHEFELLILKIAFDFGVGHLDSEKYRKKHYDHWTATLKAKTDSYDFETEARKLIEHSLLSEETITLPITGKDVIDEFDIPPGPKIKKILIKARELYILEPCTKEELIDKLINLIKSSAL